jgi:hypothetical protein
VLDRLPCRALAPLKVDELVEIADPGETSILLVPGQPGYGAMRQISQRMARCRQLPVKQRDDARFGLVEHEIADAIVAMHQAGGIVGGNVPGQPGDLCEAPTAVNDGEIAVASNEELHAAPLGAAARAAVP